MSINALKNRRQQFKRVSGKWRIWRARAGLSSSAVFFVLMPIFAIKAGSASADPTIGLNFTGSSASASTSWVPDSMGAVGPNHIVEMNNTTFRVYDKHTGLRLSATSPANFWTLGGSSSGNVDPRVVYDPTVDRWFATMLDEGNGLLLGVSKGSDPTPIANSSTRGWRAFAMDDDPTSETNTRYSDFPSLGVDAESVHVAAFLYDNNGTPQNNGRAIWSIPKADLLLAKPTLAHLKTFTLDEKKDLGGFISNLFPAPGPDDGDGRTPLLAAVIGQGLKRWDLVHTADQTTLSSGVTISVPDFKAHANARQPSPGRPISSGTSGFGTPAAGFRSNLVEANGHIWGVHLVDVAGLSGGIRWYEIDNATNHLMQSGTIADPSLDFLVPSIAVNEFGDVVIGFTASGPSKFPSAYAVVGNTIGDTTTFGALMQLKEGKGTWYDGDESDPRNRWGDYSTTVVDPSDPYHFWTFQEITTATNTWGEQITEIIVPEPTGMWVLGLGAIPMLLGRRLLRGSTARLVGISSVFLFASLALPIKPAQADPTIGRNFTGLKQHKPDHDRRTFVFLQHGDLRRQPFGRRQFAHSFP